MPLGSDVNVQVRGKATLTTLTEATVLASPGYNARLRVYLIAITNHHDTVVTKVSLVDGGSGFLTVGVGADDGSVVLPFPTGLVLGENGALTARCLTTGADVDVFALAEIEGI